MTRALWCVLLLCLAGKAQAALKTSDLYDLSSKVAAAERYRYVKVISKVVSKNPAVKPDAIHFTIHAKAGDILVPVAADGTVRFPITPALRDEDAVIESNQPKGKVGIELNVDVLAPPTLRFDPATYRAMVDEYSAALKQAGMVMRLMAPSATGLLVTVPANATATVGAGPLYTADAKGLLRIPAKAVLAATEPIVFSALPTRIEMDTDD